VKTKTLLTALALATLAATVNTALAQVDPVFMPLVTNLVRVTSPGSVGAVLSSFSSGAFWRIIVSGDDDTSSPSSFCLARTYGSGRVVALGHEGIMFDSVYDNTQFHRNVARWLNNGLSHRIGFSSGHSEGVRLDNSTAFTKAVTGEYSLAQLAATITFTSLAGVDVLVLGNAWRSFTSGEMAAVEAFVANGGGLLLVGLGWSWLTFHPGSTLADYPMAQIGASYGISWAAGILSDPTDNYSGSPVFHSFYPDTMSIHYPGHPSAPSVISVGESGMASADVLYAEARVEKSTPGTFFCVLLGEAFYFGLQEGGSGYDKHVHFAVWDPAEANPWTGSGVDKTRFGGEGTGWTTYYPFNWKTNVAYRFCAQILRESATSTLYLAFFSDPESGRWKHLATIRRTVGLAGLNYLGSFLEDFEYRNWISRSFLVGNQWARVAGGQWLDLRQAQFNCSLGSSNPYTNNYDGDVVGTFFRLETGGLTERDSSPLDIFTHDAGVRPNDLPVRPPTLGLVAVVGGPPQIRLGGVPGLNYTVQASSNLVHWTALGTVTATSDVVDVNDPAAAAASSRFYRAKLATGM